MQCLHAGVDDDAHGMSRVAARRQTRCAVFLGNEVLARAVGVIECSATHRIAAREGQTTVLMERLQALGAQLRWSWGA